MLNLILSVLPKNMCGDVTFSYLAFFYFHRRFPNKKKWFNNVLFRLRVESLSDPLRVFISDKEFLKIFIKSIIGEKYIVPTLSIIRKPEEISVFRFPHDCCIKPTHLSGKVIFVEKKITNQDREEIRGWFNENHYFKSRELNYKTLIPKVIIEPIIFNDKNLVDYKFFCYKGSVRIIQVDLNRHTNQTRKLFDCKWNDLQCSVGYDYSKYDLKKPKNLEAMIKVSQQLSIFFDFIRIDLYSNGSQIFVGEITNCHGGSFERFYPPEAEKKISSILFADSYEK